MNVTRLLNRIGLGKKIVAILLLGFLVPMSFVSVLSLNALRQQGEKERSQILQQTMEHVRNTIDSVLSNALSLSLAYTTDIQLNRMLDTHYASAYDYLLAYQEDIRPTMAVSPVFGIVDWIRIYTDNDTIVSGDDVAVVLNPETYLEKSQNWLSILDISGQDVQLRLDTQKSLTRSELDVSLIREMNVFPQYRQYCRILRISLNLSKLESCVRDLEFFQEMLLTDSAGRVIVSSNANNAVGSPLRIFHRQELTSHERLLELPLTEIPELYLIGIYPKSALSESYFRFLSRYSLFIAAILLTGLTLSAFLVRTITIRLREIGDCSQDIAQGDFTQMNEAAMGIDEVGRLAASINQMSRQLQENIEQEYGSRVRQAQLEREKAKAELKALQSQVNPHFMFNAMEAIRLKARSRGENETALMITYMARMFRRLLDWRDDLIPLGDELAFINEFLTIQRYRYDDDFSFSVEVEAGLSQAYLPKMLIQPLVENACVHGLSGDTISRQGRLSIRQAKGRLLILVEDRGEGMTPERLKEVRQLLLGGDNAIHSVGLCNVQRRCKLYYGNEAKLDAQLLPEGGTIFSMIIPLYWQKEDFHVSSSDCG